MTKFVGVLGTDGWPDRCESEWWYPASPFATYLASLGIGPARQEPFVWSGGLGGVPINTDPRVWDGAAKSLKYYLEELPLADRNLIAHSHGGNVALLAALEIPMNSLVLVSTPVRPYIEQHVAPTAVKNIGTCLHICDATWDWMGFLGGLFNGRPSLRRSFQVPGIAVDEVPGIGHSGILFKPELFPLWQQHGWADALKRQAAA